MNCPACGNEVFEGAEICFDCGEPLLEGAAPGRRVEAAPAPPERTASAASPESKGPVSFRSTPAPPSAPPKRKWRTDDPDPIRCPGCGAKNAPDLPRCRNCGDPIRHRD